MACSNWDRCRPIVRCSCVLLEEEIQRGPPKSRTAGVINAVAHADEVIETAARCMSLMGRRSRKYGGPAPAADEPLLPGRGRGRIVALSRVNTVLADEVRQLEQKLPKSGIFFKQRVGFVGGFVVTRVGSSPRRAFSSSERASSVGSSTQNEGSARRSRLLSCGWSTRMIDTPISNMPNEPPVALSRGAE